MPFEVVRVMAVGARGVGAMEEQATVEAAAVGATAGPSWVCEQRRWRRYGCVRRQRRYSCPDEDALVIRAHPLDLTFSQCVLTTTILTSKLHQAHYSGIV
jgi:hypothetical protein